MFREFIKPAIVLLLVFSLQLGLASAQYTSPTYRVDETFFGAGGDLQAQSAHYQARVAAGELGIDHSSSTNFQVYSGFNTTAEPFLEVYVTGGAFDMGYVDVNQPKAISAAFTVRSYLSSGYVVSLNGTPPKNVAGSGHTLTALTTPSSSSPGTEQFGVNLAANNIAPIGPFGAAPSQVPDSTFSFGAATANYSTSNLFKYVENDIIARSLKSSGVTQYTLSALANIHKNTLAGLYGTSIFVNVVPTF